MHKDILLILAILILSQAQILPLMVNTATDININEDPIIPINADKNVVIVQGAEGEGGNNFFSDFLAQQQAAAAALLKTVDAEVYFGSAEINVTNGDQKKIQFYGTFVSVAQCSYSKCYKGWINNYTISGENPIQGLTGNITVKPYFQFKTNSEQDYVINRNPKLDEVWIQIIEVLCQKINPQITQANPADDKAQATAKDVKVEAKQLTSGQDLTTSGPSSDTIQKPDPSLVPTYTFTRVQASELEAAKKQKLLTVTLSKDVFSVDGLSAGDQVAKLTKNVQLQGLKAPSSILTQTLVLNSDNLIKKRNLNYQVKLDSSINLNSDKGQKVPGFQGLLKLNFGLGGKVKVPQSTFDDASAALASKSQYTVGMINDRRTKLGTLLNPTILTATVDQGPTSADAQILTFNNLKDSGVDFISKLNQLDLKSDFTLVSTPIRNLQLQQNYTIYNYKKVLFSQSIFSKTFSTDVEVKCYILVYPNDHEIQCIGTFNYQLFGNTKSISIFNFRKSIKFSWTWTNTYTGTWNFNVWIGLPAPVNFIGLNFKFDVKYIIVVGIVINTASTTNAYTVTALCQASTKVDTDASAALKVIAIEGGVFLTGNLLSAGTDPKMTLTYLYTKKTISVLAQWYFWINAFSYKWGFYYRYWSFWSGWSSRKIISQWNINAVYGKWVIVNRSWDINY